MKVKRYTCYLHKSVIIHVLPLCSYIDRDTSTFTPPKQRRILKELRDFLHNPHQDIRVYPCDTELAYTILPFTFSIVTVSGRH